MPIKAEELKKQLHDLLSKSDMTQMSMKKVRQCLTEEPYSLDAADVEEEKDAIKAIVQAYVAEQQKKDEQDEEDEPLTKQAAPKKTTSATTKPVSRKRFLDNAEDTLDVTVPGMGGRLQVSKRKFSTGSCGWYGSSKLNVSVDNVPLTVRCQLTLTIQGSKDWTEE